MCTIFNYFYSRIGGKMKIRLEKNPAQNNFKAYGWQK